jgi:hypothetical protein
MKTTASCLVAAWLAGTAGVHAQSVAPAPPEDHDHAIVFELGWAGGWSRDDRLQARGGTFAFEVTPVEGWLELEVGVTAVRHDRATEIPIDLLL